MLFSSYFLQNSLQLGALETGLIMMPGACMMALFTPFTGKLYDIVGPVSLIVSGIVIMIIGTYMMGSLSIATTSLYVIIWTSVRYIGIALCNMPITNAGMSSIPVQIAGYASALNNWARQCIASLSIALFSALLAYRSSVYVQGENRRKVHRHLLLEMYFYIRLFHSSLRFQSRFYCGKSVNRKERRLSIVKHSDMHDTIAHREAIIGIVLVIIHFVWWYGFAYGLGKKPVEEYTYVFGFPAWFFIAVSLALF
ncbi:DUF997 family protein [Bacillus sp. N9]